MPSQRKPISLLQTVQAPAFPAAWTAPHLTSFGPATLPILATVQSPAPPSLEVALNLDHLVPDLGEVAAGLDQLVHLLADQMRGGVLPAAGLLDLRLPATSLAATEQDEGKEEDEKKEEQSDEEEKGDKATGVSKTKSRVPQVHCQLLESPPDSL